MASIEQKYPLNYKVRGDTLDDFGYKYLMESERIYQIINLLRENKEGEFEPQPHQIKISETGKLYIRNTDNTAWVYMGEVNKENLGMKENGFLGTSELGYKEAEQEGELNSLNVDIKGNASKIANVLIAVSSLEDGEVLCYDATAKRFVNKKVPIINDANNTISVDTIGNAGKIGGVMVSTTNIQDGEILVYRPSQGGFVNETKATGVGAKEISFTLNDNISLGSYSGTATTNISLLAISKEKPTETDASLPPFWIAAEI